MKGVIFTSFMDFAEKALGMDFVETMVDRLEPASGAVYTDVGTYSPDELMAMVGYILEETELEAEALSRDFGRHTFGHLVARYGYIIEGFRDTFDCVANLDETIHGNVRKLYPDASLPTMDARIADDGDSLVLHYQSTNPFMHVAHGLLLGCVEHYGDDVSVEIGDRFDGSGNRATFILRRNG